MDYVDLITSQHSDKPKFRNLVDSVSGCFLAVSDIHAILPGRFDLDSAIGDQLDTIGLWVGISRNIDTPLQVYFSFDTIGFGFDEGSIKGRFDPDEGITSLDDESYRTVIRAKIAANNHDGTIDSLNAVMTEFVMPKINGAVLDISTFPMVLDSSESVTYSQIFFVDNQDMSLSAYLVGGNLPAVIKAIISNLVHIVKPSGVSIDGINVPSVEGTPLFGFDNSNKYISGFDSGSISIPL